MNESHQAFLAVQAWTTTVPDEAWRVANLFGNGVVAMGLALLFVGTSGRGLLGLPLAAVLAGLVSHLAKGWFQAPRPSMLVAPEHLHVIGERLAHGSMPSGHTLTIFTAVSFMLVASRELRRPASAMTLLALASACGLARIASGAHWPADVCAGALAGIACGVLGWLLTHPSVVRQALPLAAGESWRRWRAFGVLACAAGLVFVPRPASSSEVATGLAVYVFAFAGARDLFARTRADRRLPHGSSPVRVLP